MIVQKGWQIPLSLSWKVFTVLLCLLLAWAVAKIVVLRKKMVRYRPSHPPVHQSFPTPQVDVRKVLGERGTQPWDKPFHQEHCHFKGCCDVSNKFKRQCQSFCLCFSVCCFTSPAMTALQNIIPKLNVTASAKKKTTIQGKKKSILILFHQRCQRAWCHLVLIQKGLQYLTECKYRF